MGSWKDEVTHCAVKEERGMAEGASVPALGLSNKAVFTGIDASSGNTSKDSQKKDQHSESYFIPQYLTGCVMYMMYGVAPGS